MDDEQRAAFLQAKRDMAYLQSAQTDLQGRTASTELVRYLARGINAAERHANEST